MQLTLTMLEKAAKMFDVAQDASEMEEREKEQAMNALMPKLLFATPKSSGDIKRNNKLLKALDDKNLLDAMLYF